jgi:uncharacterized protein (DUF111 family)
MNPELYDYLEDKLFENGALDVYKTPIIMKKGRPAIKLSVLAEATSLHKIENILFVETTTLGLRRYNVTKIMLDREIITLSTIYGDIPLKKGMLNGKVIKMKPEYEVCKRLAKKNRIPISTIYDEISKMYLDGDNNGQI